jgi:3-hydroxyacyl-CoA dehydrogenase
MQDTENVYFDPIFNFIDFLPDSTSPGCLCDCTLDLPDGTQLQAHQILLANTSQFFLNAFTSGMSEQETRTVTLTFNPCNLFPVILHWMYTGELNVTEETLMPTLAMARFYGVQMLADQLAGFYRERIERPAMRPALL